MRYWKSRYSGINGYWYQKDTGELLFQVKGGGLQDSIYTLETLESGRHQVEMSEVEVAKMLMGIGE